jgi:hypothetical protein
MRGRRFLLLATVLVCMNATLWLASGALGLTQVTLPALFGKSMVRADVVQNKGCPGACVEWRVDRGIVASNVPGTLTLNEADTRTQDITVSAALTRVTAAGVPFKLKNIKPGWRVLVIWPASGGPAQSVVIEKRS